jgi:hypothetical protein
MALKSRVTRSASAKSDCTGQQPPNSSMGIIASISDSIPEHSQGTFLNRPVHVETTSPLRVDNFSPGLNPFDGYPFLASPIKSTNLAASATPHIKRSPLFAPETLRAVTWENDLFAISPGMFPRKRKAVDYLDVFADTDRNEFLSPIRFVAQRVAETHPTPKSPALVRQCHDEESSHSRVKAVHEESHPETKVENAVASSKPEAVTVEVGSEQENEPETGTSLASFPNAQSRITLTSVCSLISPTSPPYLIPFHSP